MADAAAGYVEPAAPNKHLDSETTGRTVGGLEVLRQRVSDPAAAAKLDLILAALATGGAATETTLDDLRDRIGSYGVGVPEVGTTNALLREVVAGLAALNIDVNTLNINADDIDLNTDQLESIMSSIGGAIGTTTDSDSSDTAIGRLKKIVALTEDLAADDENTAREATLEMTRQLLLSGIGVTVTNPLNVTALATHAKQDELAGKIPDEEGVWDYRGGISGTPSLPAGCRVIGIAALSVGGGSYSINGGNSIPIPAGVGVELAPRCNLIAPTITFVGTDTYTVEFLGSTTAGLTGSWDSLVGSWNDQVTQWGG